MTLVGWAKARKRRAHLQQRIAVLVGALRLAHPTALAYFAFEAIRQGLRKAPAVFGCGLQPKGFAMKVINCLAAGLALTLAASAARAETLTVNREGNSVTVTGPNATVTTTETSRNGNNATYTTTVTRNGSGATYQPMGSGGYHPMGQ
jgi:hypothetical protein